MSLCAQHVQLYYCVKNDDTFHMGEMNDVPETSWEGN